MILLYIFLVTATFDPSYVGINGRILPYGDMPSTKDLQFTGLDNQNAGVAESTKISMFSEKNSKHLGFEDETPIEKMALDIDIFIAIYCYVLQGSPTCKMDEKASSRPWCRHDVPTAQTPDIPKLSSSKPSLFLVKFNNKGLIRTRKAIPYPNHNIWTLEVICTNIF